MVKDLVLVLDLDGTLISLPDQFEPWKVHLRPFLQEFLLFVFENFNCVGIWTAASRKWFDYVYRTKLCLAMPGKRCFDFVWTSERCTPKTIFLKHLNDLPFQVYLKKLKKLWVKNRFSTTKHNTLTIDDIDHAYSKNKFNAIPVSSYNINGPLHTEDIALLEGRQTLEDIVKAYHNQQNLFYQFIPCQNALDILHQYRPICSIRSLLSK